MARCLQKSDLILLTNVYGKELHELLEQLDREVVLWIENLLLLWMRICGHPALKSNLVTNLA